MKKPTVRQRRLGNQLRQLRQEARLTCKEAAALLQLSESMVARVEQGERNIRTPDLNTLLDAYGLKDNVKRAGLTQLALDASRRDWFNDYEDIFGEAFRGFLSLETEATSICHYHPQGVPGILQTESYARAVLADGLRGPVGIERMLKVRMGRKQILERTYPPCLSVVVDEQVIRRPIGGRTVLREQLTYLAAMTQRPNVEIQVLPQDLEAGVVMTGGSFSILSFPEGAIDAVFIEDVIDGSYLETDAAIRSYRVAFEKLQAVALTQDASAKLITAAERDLGRDE